MDNKSNYSETYDRLKKDGVIQPFFYVGKQNIDYEEEYKPITNDHIPGIEKGRYLISNYGNVVDLKLDKISNGHSDKDGYKRYSFATEYGSLNRGIHRIEMIVFNCNPDYNDLQVNHIDGAPSNNYITNLEWTTPKENSDHAMLTGLHKMNGEDNPNNKLTEDQVKEICELIQTGKYYDTEIADMFGVSYTNISDIHKGKIWRRISSKYDLSNKKPIALTEQQVREICELLEEGTHFTTDIGRRYGVKHQTIIAIRQGKIWGHISKDYNIKDVKATRKFNEEQIRDICKMLESGEYTNKEVAKKFDTNCTTIGSIIKGTIHRDISKDYNLENSKSYKKNLQLKNKPITFQSGKINKKKPDDK